LLEFSRYYFLLTWSFFFLFSDSLSSSGAAIIAAIVILLYVGVSLCQNCATWRFENRLREAQKRGEISMNVVETKADEKFVSDA
jgi:hypothetical protein